MHAAADALLHGTDTNCGRTYNALAEAVKTGLINESDIDVSLRRLFVARMKLGLFDPPRMVPYTSIPFSDVNAPAHQALALEAADKSMVLLKNDGTLPLNPAKYKTIAVIGPNAASLAALEGNYNGVPRDPQMPVDALRAAFPNAHVVYEQGSPYVEGISLPVPRTMFHPAAGSNEEGLKAEYFAGDSLTGRPVITRVDRANRLRLDLRQPAARQLAGGFAVRWTGVLAPPAPGRYDFTLRLGRCRLCGGRDHVSVVVNGKEVAAARNTPAAMGMGSEHIDGTTGMVAEPRPTGPPHFTLDFADTQPLPISIEMTPLLVHDGRRHLARLAAARCRASEASCRRRQRGRSGHRHGRALAAA